GLCGEERKAEGRAIKVGRLALDGAVIADVTARFKYPDYPRLDDRPVELARARAADPRFDRWYKNSVTPHRVPGHAVVTLSLKPEGAPPGDATAAQMGRIAELPDR